VSTDAVPRSDASRVKRLPARAAYDRATIDAILDAGVVGHVGLVADDGRPVVIPMLYGREGDALYLHGSVASRLTRALATGIDVCLTVTLLDGLVMARSAFHHSMNYRSVVVLGRASAVDGDEKRHGLEVIMDHLAPGRWAEAREPNDLELRQTSVLRLPVEEASAKVRTGGPIDDEEDLPLPVWAGVVPLESRFAPVVPAADLAPGIAPPPSVLALSGREL
jgi:nitroimidazol reductase NimA-like FMN-containing flavoprotein (pyridoxamine 5'-phosphate oxidase superfamily)